MVGRVTFGEQVGVKLGKRVNIAQISGATVYVVAQTPEGNKDMRG